MSNQQFLHFSQKISKLKSTNKISISVKLLFHFYDIRWYAYYNEAKNFQPFLASRNQKFGPKNLIISSVNLKHFKKSEGEGGLFKREMANRNIIHVVFQPPAQKVTIKISREFKKLWMFSSSQNTRNTRAYNKFIFFFIFTYISKHT